MIISIAMVTGFHFDALVTQYASAEWIIIGSDNGMSPVWWQAVAWITDAIVNRIFRINEKGSCSSPEKSQSSDVVYVE